MRSSTPGTAPRMIERSCTSTGRARSGAAAMYSSTSRGAVFGGGLITDEFWRLRQSLIRMTLVQDTPTLTAPDADRLEPHRAALLGYCYRMLGSPFEAEDAVQETMLRAWRGLEGFDGRSELGTWLHRIATNVCLDMLKSKSRRATPMDLGPAQ